MSCMMFSCKLLQIGHTDFQGTWPTCIYMLAYGETGLDPALDKESSTDK